MHLARPFEVGSIDESFAKTGRTAIVHAQRGIAPVSKPLVIGVQTPHVARPRPAVDEQYHRQPLGRPRATRPGQVRYEFEPVAGPNDNPVHRHERQPLPWQQWTKEPRGPGASEDVKR